MPGRPGSAFGRPAFKLMPTIHVLNHCRTDDVVGRDKPGHDDVT
jgi:hypothetical protein